MNEKPDVRIEDGHVLIDSHVSATIADERPPAGRPVVRSSLAIDDEARIDRIGTGPEEYERGPHSIGVEPLYRFGPELLPQGVRFRLFAPSAKQVDLLVEGAGPMPMQASGDGWFAVERADAGPGTPYRFRALGLDFPDPASRGQQEDAGGWSLVRAPLPPAAERSIRPWHEAVIAEVHVGTATPEGTFAGLAGRLGHFAAAGYTAIELMPIADFPGSHNWGYDGVLPFAPERSYGTPEDLRALVDAAHALDLAVILDVVYNHLGPIDNYLPHYAASFFDEAVRTPWGAGLNFADPTVRLFFLENVRHWLQDYDFDGLRFDAVHEFGTAAADDFKRQLAAMARAIKSDALLILENGENGTSWLERGDDGRPRHFDAQWNDDIHHVLHVIATEQRSGYYRGFAEETFDKARRALAEGFIRRSESEPDPALLPPSAFVSFIQNHDQIGNQPDGHRLAGRLDAERLDFLHFVIMLSPQVPMFFMGEEAHIRAPFPFFGDLRGELRDEVRAGRAEQAIAFYENEHADALVPDPGAVETVDTAKLDWGEFEAPERSRALDRFRALNRLRRQHLWPLTASLYRGSEGRQDGSAVAVSWRYDGGRLVMALNAAPQPGSIEIATFEPVATTGRFAWQDGRLSLGPWSAVIAILPPEA